MKLFVIVPHLFSFSFIAEQETIKREAFYSQTDFGGSLIFQNLLHIFTVHGFLLRNNYTEQ